ncbi:hypothetical protein [Paenibacillus sp. EZ-K15]|nr:hypothetical protein [Paenibacillus sp. EZ-K15]
MNFDIKEAVEILVRIAHSPEKAEYAIVPELSRPYRTFCGT